MHGIQIVTALILFAAASQALAKDVSQEQSAVQYARQEFEKADAEHKIDAKQAASTAKALESLKKATRARAEKGEPVREEETAG